MLRPRQWEGAILGRSVNSSLSSLASVLVIQPPEWMEDAVCASTDPEAFFPEQGGTTRPAKAMCNGIPGRTAPCPVREQCLQYALEIEAATGHMPGIYGGLSDHERRKLRRTPA